MSERHFYSIPRGITSRFMDFDGFLNMRLLRSSALAFSLLASLPASQLHAFRHEGVLGTSLDLLLMGVSAPQARHAEALVLAEIERLRSILSTYDPASEIRQVMAGRRPVTSSELAEVLDLYARYNTLTDGAIDLQVKGQWNVDALGKAFILDRCVELLQAFVLSGLINIGGDLRAFGPYAFPVRIADPDNFSDNGPGLGVILIQDSALASSGSYLRPGHLLDPRTGRPVPKHHAATLLASTAIEANAWSTALCVNPNLPLPLGISHVHPVSLFQPATQADQVGNRWPAGFQLKIALDIKKPSPAPGERFKRPYVAVWIETEKGELVRNLALWGDEEKYWPEMTAWWKANKGDRTVALALASATRRAGQYSLTWDGLDNSGQPVLQGTYRVRLEVNREHANHVRPSINIECGSEPTTVTFKPTAETNASTLEYGPVPKSSDK